MSVSGKPSTRRQRLLHRVAGTFVVILLLGNAVAFMQAWRMLHFTADGTRTRSPENLSTIQRLGLCLTGIRVPKPHDDRTPLDDGLCYTTVALTAADGPHLEAWDIPAPSDSTVSGTVLLCHGYGACKAWMLPDAQILHRLGWRVVLLDFRGSGDSEGFTTTVGYREARDVAAAVAWIEAHQPARPLVLYGTSMGAAAVLGAVAREGVIPDGIVLECPFDRLLSAVRNRFAAMKLPAFPASECMVFWGSVQLGFNGFAFRPVRDAEAVQAPTLILVGGRDARVKPSEPEAIRRALRGPANLFVFPECGHESYAGRSPETYRRIIGDWLALLPRESYRKAPLSAIGSQASSVPCTAHRPSNSAASR